MSEPVIIAVPPKGGTLNAVMERLVAAGWINADLVQGIRAWISADKKRIKLEEKLIRYWEQHQGDEQAVVQTARDKGLDSEVVRAALDRMRRYQDPEDGSSCLGFTPKPEVDKIIAGWRTDIDPVRSEAAKTLHLELDLSRYGRPSRVMFDHLEFEWQAPDGSIVRGVLVGTDHEVAPTYLRRHKRDLSLSCYDAFHNTLLDALDTGKVHDWHELMEHLSEADTDVRILGSLNLDDYLGHFVLMPQEKADRIAALNADRDWNGNTGPDPKLAILAEDPILIDANYEGIYRVLLDADEHGLEFEHTTRDIEQLCAQEGRTALYIVQSGGTVARTPGLCVVGAELLTSETIIAVNKERLEHNAAVGHLVDSLGPVQEDRSQKWRDALRERLGSHLV